MTRGIFPGQGLNQCPLHTRQILNTGPSGKPVLSFWQLVLYNHSLFCCCFSFTSMCSDRSQPSIRNTPRWFLPFPALPFCLFCLPRMPFLFYSIIIPSIFLNQLKSSNVISFGRSLSVASETLNGDLLAFVDLPLRSLWNTIKFSNPLNLLLSCFMCECPFPEKMAKILRWELCLIFPLNMVRISHSFTQWNMYVLWSECLCSQRSWIPNHQEMLGGDFGEWSGYDGRPLRMGSVLHLQRDF